MPYVVSVANTRPPVSMCQLEYMLYSQAFTPCIFAEIIAKSQGRTVSCFNGAGTIAETIALAAIKNTLITRLNILRMLIKVACNLTGFFYLRELLEKRNPNMVCEFLLMATYGIAFPELIQK